MPGVNFGTLQFILHLSEAPSRIDVDQFRILLIPHRNILPLGRRREWKFYRVVRKARTRTHVSRPWVLQYLVTALPRRSRAQSKLLNSNFGGPRGTKVRSIKTQAPASSNQVLGQLRDFSYTCVSRRRLILKLDRGLRACVRWTPVDDTYLFNDGLEFGNAILEGSLVFHVWIRLVNLLGAESGV